jgi:hypothetical protein
MVLKRELTPELPLPCGNANHDARWCGIIILNVHDLHPLPRLYQLNSPHRYDCGHSDASFRKIGHACTAGGRDG